MCGTPVDRFRRTAKKLTRSLSRPLPLTPVHPPARSIGGGNDRWQGLIVGINCRIVASEERCVNAADGTITAPLFLAYSADRVLSFMSNRSVTRGESMHNYYVRM